MCDLMVSWRRVEPGSLGSVVSDYGLDNRAIGVSIPGRSKGFFL